MYYSLFINKCSQKIIKRVWCCRTVTDEEWAMYTQENIDRAAKELVAGRPIRSYINQLLKQVIEDLIKQYNITNEAFRKRIEEYKETKSKLENQHFEVCKLWDCYFSNMILIKF